MVSSDFGNDEASRQVTFGLACAIAGAARVVAATAAPAPVAPAFLMNERRSMNSPPLGPFWLPPEAFCQGPVRAIAAQYMLTKTCPDARSGGKPAAPKYPPD